jgi:hypothetical protein
MDSLESISYTLQIGSKEEKFSSLNQLNEFKNRQSSKDSIRRVFHILQEALTDPITEIRLLALTIINDFVSFFKREIDSYVGIVLPKIVANLGDNEVSIIK